MESYEPYAATFKRRADFRVKYQLLPKPNDEPRYVIQGSRLDFRYVNDGYLHNSHYIIWPEFEDNGGFIILDKWTPVEPVGTARMWIVNQNLIEYHRAHLKIGTIGYMVGGGGDIATCEVIEMLNLHQS